MANLRRPALLLATGVAPLVLLGTAGCAGEDAARDPEPSVAVATWTVELRPVTVDRHWYGRLEPLRSYPIQAPRSGRVTALMVRDGAMVRSGDVLARMEGPDVEARRSVLLERLEFLEAELARWEALAEAGAAGPAEVTQATLRVLEARDQTRQVESLSDMYLIRAPASGVVNGTVVSPGANVADGQTLMQLEDSETLGISLVVPAAESAFLEDPQHLSVVDDRGAEYGIDRVVVSSDPHPAFVRADVYVRGDVGRRAATVNYRSTDVALLVPWTAVASDGDMYWVAVVVEGEPPRIERRAVDLGRAFADGIEVSSGLAPGAQVIRFEPRSIPEGRAVRPRSVNPGTARS